jgi:hypothetical protein
MQRTYLVASVVVMLAGLWVGGCHDAATPVDFEQMMMTKAERPAELDLLDPFVGIWKGTGTMHFAGNEEAAEADIRILMHWDADRWILRERFEIMPADAPGTVESGVGIWMWDARDQVFRTWSFGAEGMTGTGAGTYDAEANMWHFSGTAQSLMNAQVKTYGEGTITVNGDEIEWTWTEWTCPAKEQLIVEYMLHATRSE